MAAKLPPNFTSPDSLVKYAHPVLVKKLYFFVTFSNIKNEK